MSVDDGPAVLDKTSSDYNAINGIGKNTKKKSIYNNAAIDEFGGIEE